MADTPPAHVRQAASVVETWLTEQNAKPLTPEQVAALSPADRLDYTRRRSTDLKMPDWKDPRAP